MDGGNISPGRRPGNIRRHLDETESFGRPWRVVMALELGLRIVANTGNGTDIGRCRQSLWLVALQEGRS